jgi:hypothetical protein
MHFIDAETERGNSICIKPGSKSKNHESRTMGSPELLGLLPVPHLATVPRLNINRREQPLRGNVTQA